MDLPAGRLATGEDHGIGVAVAALAPGAHDEDIGKVGDIFGLVEVLYLPFTVWTAALDDTLH